MASRCQQDTLRFPVRKTRSSRLTNIKTLSNESNEPCKTTRRMKKSLNLGKRNSSTSFYQFGIQISPFQFTHRSPKKNPEDSDEENNSDTLKKLGDMNCKHVKNMKVKNELLPVVLLERSPLKEMLIKCNSKENSPEKLKNYNITPKKNKESNLLKCSIPLNFDSPRRSPRKLNFANSPSHLINKLSFTSPKKSSAVIGLHSVELSIYQSLKASLTQNCDTHIIGREAETSILKNFIGSHLQTAQPGSLYISGAPGTGKTALVTRIMKTFLDISFKNITINCMSRKSSKDIFCCIAEGLNLSHNHSERETVHLIEKSLTKSKMPM
ncbi:hypothetical protein Avbf_16439 [Armadillidium vulgare]|nr:hypothetical protein Avbf_16439 [Armadillidium vulgare]